MIDQHDRLKDLVMNLIQHDVWLHTRSYMLKVAIDFDCVFPGSLSSMSLINRLWEICVCFLWSRLYLSLHFSQNGAIRLKTLAAHFYEGVNCNKHYLSTFNGSFNLNLWRKRFSTCLHTRPHAKRRKQGNLSSCGSHLLHSYAQASACLGVL